MDKPLLVSDPLIRPMSTGLKTETRRLNGLDWVNGDPDRWEVVQLEGPNVKFKKIGFPETCHLTCRYGAKGDTLWVRENWYVGRGYNGLKPSKIPEQPNVRRGYMGDGPRPDWAGKCRPSIHMPRWLCRYNLGIIGLRIERLHTITEEGARREGFPDQDIDEFSGFEFPALVWFQNTWVNLNGRESWDLNPWVWVISFKLLKPKK